MELVGLRVGMGASGALVIWKTMGYATNQSWLDNVPLLLMYHASYFVNGISSV